ncbi:MAG: hypothetical protein KIT58_01675 [Planctomycetota bacterium]|nr:hypothetical protein [Planctomycetota bacterium]
MSLLQAEIDHLVGLLIQANSQPDQARQQVRVLSEPAGKVVDALPGGLAIRPLYLTIVHELLAAREFRELARVLRAVAGAFATVRAYADRIDALGSEPASGGLFDQVRPAGVCFANRRKLREGLQLLLQSPTIRTLVVAGETTTGKSWTEHLVFAIASHRGDGYCIHRAPESVESLVERFLADVAPAAPIPALTNLASPQSWYEKLANTVYGHAAGTQRFWWWVIDDVEHSPPEVVDFLLKMTERLERKTAMRLVLLGYPRDKEFKVPKLVGEYHVRDDIPPNHLNDADVRLFLERWSAQTNRPLTSALLEQSVSQVATRAAAAGGTVAAWGTALTSVVQGMEAS